MTLQTYDIWLGTERKWSGQAEKPELAIGFAIADHPELKADKGKLVAVVVEDEQVSILTAEQAAEKARELLLNNPKTRKKRKDAGEKRGARTLAQAKKKGRNRGQFFICAVGTAGPYDRQALVDYLTANSDTTLHVIQGHEIKFTIKERNPLITLKPTK